MFTFDINTRRRKRPGPPFLSTSMSSAEKRPADQQIREALAQAVENASLRDLARQIGMSPTGLKKFMEGTNPYSPTLRRLMHWYLTMQEARTNETRVFDAVERWERIRARIADAVAAIGIADTASKTELTEDEVHAIIGNQGVLPRAERQRLWEVTKTFESLARPGEEIAAQVAAAAGDERELLVVADLDVVPPEVLAEVMAALDALHRAYGGGGLRISATQTGTVATVEVAA